MGRRLVFTSTGHKGGSGLGREEDEPSVGQSEAEVPVACPCGCGQWEIRLRAGNSWSMESRLDLGLDEITQGAWL